MTRALAERVGWKYKIVYMVVYMVHWHSQVERIQYHCQFMPKAVTDVKECKFYSIVFLSSSSSSSFLSSAPTSDQIITLSRNERISNGSSHDLSSG